MVVGLVLGAVAAYLASIWVAVIIKESGFRQKAPEVKWDGLRELDDGIWFWGGGAVASCVFWPLVILAKVIQTIATNTQPFLFEKPVEKLTQYRGLREEK